MKKIFFYCIFFLTSLNIFAQNELSGIWEAKDRLVFFEENEDSQDLFIVLKNFYGWYYDRAAEAQSYADKGNRARNDATPKNAEHIPYTVSKDENYQSWYFNIQYTKRDSFLVPMVNIGDNFFLNFYTRDLDFSSEEEIENAKNTYEGFYRGNQVSKGLQIANQKENENIACFYISGNKIYNIRYWLTDMEYSPDYVDFTYGEDSFMIPKHIQHGKLIYTCVNGRSKKVRNTMPPKEFKSSDYIFDQNHRVLVLDKEPYLTKLIDKETFDDLIEIIKKNNSRRHPPIQPFFKDLNLDYHWDLIDYIEQNNEIIQQVRRRQKAFGIRGKDMNN